MEVEKTPRRNFSRGTSPHVMGTNTLEKKNKDLTRATKELEARMRNLQLRTETDKARAQQQQQRGRSLPRPLGSTSSRLARELPSAPSSRSEERPPAVEERRRGSTVTSRIREREAEFQKQVLERDDQIGRLKERLHILSSKLAESKEKDLRLPRLLRDKEKVRQAQTTMEDGTELQNIIRQVTKERLQLERHLQIANDSLQRNNGVDLQKYLSLESTNQHLRQQLDSLDMLQQEYRLVEIQHREKEEACNELLNTLKYKSSLVEDLESQLAKVIEKNAELTIENSDLQKKVVELHHVSDECQQLKNTLNKVESECVSAKSEVRNLSGKVRNLECVLEEMHKAAENRREIERQHKEALESLKRKQDEVELVATKKQAEIIEQLKTKIANLETERHVQNERHQELILEMAELKRYGGSGNGVTSGHSSLMLPAEIENPSDNIEIDEIMAKLEQDNKFLAELEKSRAANNNHKGDTSPPHHLKERSGSAITDSGFLSQSSLNGGTSSSSPVTARTTTGSISSSTSMLARTALELPRLTGADKMNLLNGGSFTAASMINSLTGAGSMTTLGCRDVIIDKDGMVEIPGKGWCWVYLARYSYDPFQHSPNDTPEAELAINAGDYILVWSDPDEDGFFDGEIIDGRKGLVPSNFVERLEGDDLIEFYQSVVMGIGDGDDSICTSIPQDLDFISSDEGLEEQKESRGKYFTSRKATLSQYYASCTDLDMTEDECGLEGSAISDYIPPPKHLTLETQLNRTLLVGWTAPDCPAGLVDSYHVLLDGEVQATVKASEGHHLKAAILSRADGAGQVHRVSVKTIGTNRKSSNEAGCTMLFGKDAPLGPTALRATNVRTTSATVSWLPSNSNFLHTLCLNNVEVRTVKQGVFRHSIAGLTPNTSYRITVRAKNIKAAQSSSFLLSGGSGQVTKQLDTLSSHIEIRTLPQGLPDPPLDVQVDAGPEPGTINILWLPVTITQFGLSNGAPVTGYVVYADGESVQDIDDPTADSAVISLAKVGKIKAVSVRTKSKDKLSVDSESCLVPPSLLGDRHVLLDHQPSSTHLTTAAKSATVVDAADDPDSGEEDSETELLERLQQGRTNTHSNGNSKQRELIINYSGYPELDSDIGPSELSDIAEEPEDELTDTEDNIPTNNRINNNNNLYKASVVNTISSWKDHANSATTSGSFNGQHASSQFDPRRYSNLVLVNNKNHNKHLLLKSSVPGTTETAAKSTLEQQHQRNNSNNYEFSNSNKKFADSSTSVFGNNRNDRMRIFVALFDYDPPTMSPNPDACEEELPFREGQLIKVYGEKDSDGFYWGEAGGNVGFVPCNMVSEVQVDDERVAEELFREQAAGQQQQQQQQQQKQHAATTSSTTSVARQTGDKNAANAAAVPPALDRWADIYEDMPMRRKMALYDYDPRELSPNVDSEVELSFRTGDIITIYGEMDDDGFYMGELRGSRGLVPSNFLTDIPAGLDGKLMVRQVVGGSGSQPRSNGLKPMLTASSRW